jgi:hypothetical protein
MNQSRNPAMWMILLSSLLLLAGCGDPISSAIKDWNIDPNHNGVDLREEKNVHFLIQDVGESFKRQANTMGSGSDLAAADFSFASQWQILTADNWAKMDEKVERMPAEFRSLYKKWKSTVQDLQEILKKQKP